MDMPAVAKHPALLPGAPAEFPAPGSESVSFCTIHSSGGMGVTVWSLPSSRLNPDSKIEARLQISPDRPAIIGRANGGDIEYLDPSYVPSPIMPGTGKTILQHDGAASDTYVSRAHFMLRAHPRGVLLVNGVPRRGGGIRPPRNWTEMFEPQRRMLLPGEELQIDRGASASIGLPNGTRLVIAAE